MTIKRFLLEEVHEGDWRVTSPDDVGVHLRFYGDPTGAVDRARQMVTDLEAARAASS